jgi:hypothetical protein
MIYRGDLLQKSTSSYLVQSLGTMSHILWCGVNDEAIRPGETSA